MKSVARYTKTHWLLRARSEVGRGVLAQGEKSSGDMRKCLSDAISSSSGARTALGRSFVFALRHPKFADRSWEFQSLASRPERRFGSLDKKRKPELVALARAAGLTVTGSKQILVERLTKAAQHVPPSWEGSMRSDNASSWSTEESGPSEASE